MENLEPNPISVRIAELIACKTGGSRTLFAHKVGCSKQRLTNILAGKGIGLATVEALLRTFPDLNARWIIMGEGYMLHVTEPKLGTKYTLIKAFERYLPYMSKLINVNIKKFEYNGEVVCPELSTYYARHTWATIAASLDIPKETIAAALGHGSKTVTDIYIDFDQKKVDAANRKVIDYVLEVQNI